ncbi:MAG: 30S ribosomal protein S6 [Caldicoprobacterales bacterium]|nr:30S ribosomal protein S6 [Clostridia bacterium]MDI9512849.1 30S ribosomal protein S6 [Bacillota bacterium]NLH58648.1 30S ribosomal protein S6 [Clostridiales bacterium]
MNNYECIYVIRHTVDEEGIKALVERFNGLIAQEGGEVTNVDEWGKRRLAYPIDDDNEGYYVLINYTAAPQVPQEIERVFRITDDIIRFITIKLD